MEKGAKEGKEAGCKRRLGSQVKQSELNDLLETSYADKQSL